jgi:hypothetical protein
MSFVGRLSKRPLSVPLLALTVCRWRFLERNTSDNLELDCRSPHAGPLSATLPCPEDGQLAVIDCDVASHGLTQLRLLVSRRQPKAWNGKNANLAFDFDDALLQLADP